MKSLLSYLMVAGLCLYGSLSMGCSSTQPTTSTTPAPTVAATTPPPASPAAASPAASPANEGSPSAAGSPGDEASPGAGDNDATLLEGGTVMTHKGGGLQFTLPKDWKNEQKGDVLSASNADDSVTMIFNVTSESDVKKVTEDLSKIVDQTLDDVEVTNEATTEEINGLNQVWAAGNGTYEGKKVNWDVSVVLGGTKPMAILAVGEIDKNEELVYAVYRSIQAAK